MKIVDQRLGVVGVGGDEGMVENVARGVVKRHERLHDPLQSGRIPAVLHLEVGGRDRCGGEGAHLHRVLRIGETFERAFLERIEHDDRHAAARAFVQGAHHARMIGPWVVPHGDDQVARVEVFQGDRALADADRHRQADAGRLVAHVRAIREIARPVFPREDLEQEGGLVGGPARGCRTPPCWDRAGRAGFRRCGRRRPPRLLAGRCRSPGRRSSDG